MRFRVTIPYKVHQLYSSTVDTEAEAQVLLLDLQTLFFVNRIAAPSNQLDPKGYVERELPNGGWVAADDYESVILIARRREPG